MDRTDGEPRPLLSASAAGLAAQLLLQLVVGIALSLRYQADPATAHSSAATLHQGFFGFLQACHYWGSALFILTSLVHLGFATWTGAYMGKDRPAYASAIFFFLCALAFQLTGNVLPFDRHGVQTAGIEAGIAARTPLVGGHLANLILGGNGFNDHTLGRWYFLHRFVVPLLGLLALGLWFRFRRPLSPKWLPWVPVAAVALLGALVPSPLGSAAGAADYGEYNARVSWYVWPLHGTMRLFELLGSGAGWIGSVLLPGLLIAFLLCLALLGDRVSTRVARGVFLFCIALFAVGSLAFGGGFAPVVGSRDPVDSAPATSGGTSAPVDSELAKRGQDAFNKLPCADCHGKDGAEAGGGPALTKAWQRHSDADYYIRYIRNPSSVQPNSTMPAFDKLPDADVRAIAEFLRSKK